MNVEMRNVVFGYDETTVLKNVNFSVKSGEIRALLGGNGAGKTTLMNILGGVLPCRHGSILLDEKPTKFMSPQDSLKAGIGFIHQELNLIPDLTVYENLFINNLSTKFGLITPKEMIEKANKLFTDLNVEIDPYAYVRDLDVSYKQITEIGRALIQDVKILIMDEPTTSLSNNSIGHLFELMKTLKKMGIAIIFISHKLNEVMDICDTYTVFRDGEVAKEGSIRDTSVKELARLIAGRALEEDKKRINPQYGDEVFRIESLDDGKKIHGVSLSVRAGEILGVTGLMGNGQDELFRMVFGARKVPYKGAFFYKGQKYTPKDTDTETEREIAYIPKDRGANGILKDMSILENGTITILPKLRRLLFIDSSKARTLFSEQKEILHIKMNKDSDGITDLSGGNQQKVILARWLMNHPNLLIMDNPTQGVDVAAKADIYSIIRDIADKGTAVIVLSPEAQEIARICERAIILFRGTKAAELEGDELTEENITFYSTGGIRTQENNTGKQDDET